MGNEQATGDGQAGGFITSRITPWLAAHRFDLAILVALAAVAGSVRLTLLVEIPAGLHGDEAWTGIDAARILDEGWIGPYVTSALGQASGPLYFAAPFVGLFGETVFSIRLASAVLGIATVLVTYLAVRVMFDRTVATFAAVLLAVGVWHLHYSRLAFPVIAWPLLEMLTLLFLFLGIKTGRLYHFAIAGLFFGGGIYTYNAYPAFVFPTALFIAWIGIGLLLAPSGRVELLRRYVARIAVMAAITVIVALPMFRYMADSSNSYFNHQETISVFEQDEWGRAGFADRVDILRGNAWEFYEAAFWSGQADGADGAGHQAMVDRVTLVFLIVGALILLARWRRPASVAVLLMVLMLPAGTIVTTQGLFRQTLGMVPFLAVLAAIPLALWWERSARFAPNLRYLSYGTIAGVVGLIAFLNLSFYFGEFPDTLVARSTFTPALAETSGLMSELPEDQLIYFYSDRWSFDYETVRYLTSDRPGEDRSRVFSDTTGLEPDLTQNIAYVFMDPYLDRIDEVAALYPGGTRVDGDSIYQAYLLPRSQEPGPTPTPELPRAARRQRDAIRTQDLEAIGLVIDAYHEAEGSYPDTDDGVQTLCVLQELDVGCALLDEAPLPEDPLGDAAANGYFYTSDGESYVVYAQRESEMFPACEEHPEFLQHFGSLLCVQVP